MKIRINISKEEYQKLLYYPPEKRIIQVGEDWYMVTELSEEMLKAVPYRPINIIGQFREERDPYFAGTQEYLTDKE